MSYTNPKNVYGTWVELNVLESIQEVIVLNEDGVYRNDHLVTTRFDYDGESVKFVTGNGDTVYRVTGTPKLPELKRIEPETPQQILVRKEDQHFFEETTKGVLRPKISLSGE